MRKKSTHPFYKLTILCEIIVRVGLGLEAQFRGEGWVTVRVRIRVSMLSVSVSALSGVRVFQITVNIHSTIFKY